MLDVRAIYIILPQIKRAVRFRQAGTLGPENEAYML
jgi:hypothetical protein